MTDPTQPAPRSATPPAAAVPKANGPAAIALGLAIASLFFALTVPIPIWGLFMLFLAAPLGIAALIVGYSGLKQARNSGSGRGRAITALVLAYLSLAICVFTTLFWVIAMATPR
jgi:hypothetical protein